MFVNKIRDKNDQKRALKFTKKCQKSILKSWKWFPFIKRTVNKCKYNPKFTKKQQFSVKNKSFFNKKSKKV